MAEKLKYFVNGQFRESKTDKWYDLHNPSTGEITGQAPCCTNDEVLEAIAAAKAAYPGWSATPAIKRAQILYRVRELILERMDELTMSVAKENGKVWAESEGDVLKAKEGTELATQVPSLMMGESIMDASRGYDTVKYREPLGVFAGIVPVNFPAMIPLWLDGTHLYCHRQHPGAESRFLDPQDRHALCPAVQGRRRAGRCHQCGHLLSQ